MRAKLGWTRAADAKPTRALAADWLALLHAHAVDFTLAWRRLADAAAGDAAPLRALFADAAEPLIGLARSAGASAARRAGGAGRCATARNARANPAYIPRNHQVEDALAAAVE